MKPVFHTQMALSTAEMPRKTNMMVSEPLARTFMTYLTVMTDLSSMLPLMYFWQHIPQKTILEGGAETGWSEPGQRSEVKAAASVSVY